MSNGLRSKSHRNPNEARIHVIAGSQVVGIATPIAGAQTRLSIDWLCPPVLCSLLPSSRSRFTSATCSSQRPGPAASAWSIFATRPGLPSAFWRRLPACLLVGLRSMVPCTRATGEASANSAQHPYQHLINSLNAAPFAAARVSHLARPAEEERGLHRLLQHPQTAA